jgi:hypothetical protein
MQWYFSSGDLDFFWKEQLQSFSWLPQVFRKDVGFGVSGVLSLWLDYPFRLVLKILSSSGLSWFIIEKLLWLSVFVIGIYSSYCLAKYILKTRLSSGIASFIYIANTYFLLLFGGRQLGVALAYSLSPLVLLKFIQFIDTTLELRGKSYELRKKTIGNGLSLALLVCFDLRLAYLVLGAIVLYLVSRIWYLVLHKKFSIPDTLYLILYTFVIPLFVAMVVHLFWILPIIMVRGGFGLEQEFTNAGMLKFLSVADFSHALSLLHPNWPENLFGKVYFLQPEFLMLPVLSFGALFFFNKTNPPTPRLRRASRTNIIFFALLALVGAFLAKGANEPFGGVYVWVFEHVPGFVMFRDPTKFYLYIAIGYSILIPHTLQCLSIWFKNRNGDLILNTLFVIFWLFTIRAVFTGKATGNFRPLVLTHEYVELKDMLVNDKVPYRTLWIPSADKFVYSSDIHPLLTSDALWKNASMGALLTAIDSPEFFKTVHDAGARYIIIPQDLEKRIFVSDYKYDQSKRDSIIEAVEKTGLRKLPELRELAIFENPTYKFKIVIPEYVEKQEYWSRIGLVIGGSILIALSGLVYTYNRKMR